MIVLDDQLMGRSVETTIARWYPGSVRFLADLRPDSVVKDEVVPLLLTRQIMPIFVTINVSDFWRRVGITNAFCVVCFGFPDSRIRDIPPLLQRLFRHPDYRTKSTRRERVTRVSAEGAFYYTAKEATIRSLENWFSE